MSVREAVASVRERRKESVVSERRGNSKTGVRIDGRE